MKFFSNKKITSQILSILLVFIMTFTTFVPITSAANNGGGKLFEPIVHLLSFVADLAIELLQDFLWDGSEINEDTEYKVYIGPATIFAGKIPRIRC